MVEIVVEFFPLHGMVYESLSRGIRRISRVFLNRV